MLAAVALHALTGSPPWPGATSTEALALARICALDGIADRLAEAGVAPTMAAVLCRALSPDPHRRGTAADLALELRHSGEPVAVELSAGRARPEPVPWRGARHAAHPPSGGAPGHASPVDRGTRTDTGSGGRRGAPAPTRAVKAPPRPLIPRPRRRRVPRGLVPVAAVVVGAMAVAVLAVAMLWRSSDTDAQPRARGVAPSSSPTPHAWPTVLSSLDAVRARAFASGSPGLLRNVYVDGPLLRADAAMLARIVPSGCGLHGVHTRYSKVRARVRGRTVALTATATLSHSTLVCPGRATRRAAGAGPAVLHVTLTWTSSGLRIADQQVMPPSR